MKFSQRGGYKPVNEIIQIDSIDERLRTKMYNCICRLIFDRLDLMFSQHNIKEVNKYCSVLWTEFFDEIIDSSPPYYNPTLGYYFKFVFKKKYFELKWYEIYDLIEFICGIDGHYFTTDFQKYCNDVLKKENSGYRLVNCCIIQTTSDVEIKEIEQALSTSVSNIKTHLESALKLLTNRENPDYRNSIKESISSVEALCCKIVGNNKATLGEALSIIEKKHRLHTALKKAFSSFYGYTSDAGGIRHKLLENDTEISYEEAKFMLVSCSAFTNYLQSVVK